MNFHKYSRLDGIRTKLSVPADYIKAFLTRYFFVLAIVSFIVTFEFVHRVFFTSDFFIHMMFRDHTNFTINLLNVFYSDHVLRNETKDLLVIRKVLFFYLNFLVIGLFSLVIDKKRRDEDRQKVKTVLYAETLVMNFFFAISFLIVLRLDEVNAFIFSFVIIAISSLTFIIGPKVYDYIEYTVNTVHEDYFIEYYRKEIVLALFFLVFLYFSIVLIFNTFISMYAIQSEEFVFRTRVTWFFIVGSIVYMYQLLYVFNMHNMRKTDSTRVIYFQYITITLFLVFINLFYYLTLF